jgi:prevent-host-death family protein
MKIASIAEIKAKLSAYLHVAENTGPVVITRNGKAVAILMAPDDEEDLERVILSRSPRFRALIDRSKSSIKAGRGLSSKSFWKTAKQRSAKSRG